MNQDEIYTYIQNRLKEKYPDLNMEAGFLCYDLCTPLCYMASELYNRMDDAQKELNPLEAGLEMLIYWAKPRIGEPKKATSCVLVLQGEEVAYRTWIYQNTYTFLKTEDIQEQTIQVQASNTGALPVQIGETLHVEGNDKITATITQIVTPGTFDEEVEAYRRRYLLSLTTDSQAGLGSYYIEKIQEHELVGYVGIDYEQSMGGDVRVYVVNTSYQQMSVADLTTIQNYYTVEKNIVPFGQQLLLSSLSPVTLSIEIIYKGEGLTPKIAFDFLQSLNQSKYIPEVMNHSSLRTTLSYVDIRNQMITTWTEYGSVEKIRINEEEDFELLLDKQYPGWDETRITITKK